MEWSLKMFIVRKFICILAVTAYFVSFNLPVFAEYRPERDYFVGEIIHVDTENDKITIYDYMNEAKRTFFVENGVGEDLKPGVEVMVSVLKGTNTAKRVKILVGRNIHI